MKQVAHLGFDFGGGSDSVGDFGAQEVAIPLAQPMHSDFDGALLHLQFAGQFAVRMSRAVAKEARFERVEERALIARAVFSAELLHNTFKQSHRPTILEGLFRRTRVGRFDPVAGFGGIELIRYVFVAATALLTAPYGLLTTTW